MSVFNKLNTRCNNYIPLWEYELYVNELFYTDRETSRTLTEACILGDIPLPISRDNLIDAYINLYDNGIGHNLVGTYGWCDIVYRYRVKS